MLFGLLNTIGFANPSHNSFYPKFIDIYLSVIALTKHCITTGPHGRCVAVLTSPTKAMTVKSVEG